jgi:hypothetical protein
MPSRDLFCAGGADYTTAAFRFYLAVDTYALNQ